MWEAQRRTRPFFILVAACGAAAALPAASSCRAEGATEDSGSASGVEPSTDWVYLIGEGGPSGLVPFQEQLKVCGGVKLVPGSNELAALPGRDVVAALSDLDSRTVDNLVSAQSFGDCLLQLEFLIGRGGNSGVKLQKRYEIQLFDSHGKQDPTARDSGGVYPHWTRRALGFPLTYIDEGVPPRTNAAKPAGEWQGLEIRFRAPRFDPEGRKVENAEFRSVSLNGVLIHEGVELDSPTGNASTPLPEVARAPILLQIDHGAVAFRNVRVLPLEH